MSSSALIYAAGFNAFSQLRLHTTKDIRDFQPLSLPPECHADSDLSLLYTCWSTTLLVDAQRATIWSLGHQHLDQDLTTISQHLPAPCAIKPSGVIGDHDGLRAAVNHRGDMMWVRGADDTGASGPSMSVATPHQAARACGYLSSLPPTDLPKWDLIAAAGNGKVVAIDRQMERKDGQTPEDLCVVRQFEDFQHLKTWYTNPRPASVQRTQTFRNPGLAKQLIANTANFLLLTEAGEVYSWGDPRHLSLGRPISETPADQPGMLEALGGLSIIKLATGGWNSAALSEDGALYFWGPASMPGHEDVGIKCLRGAAGEVVLVEIPGDDGEPADVVDVAIGDGHMAVVTAHAGGNRLYVAGQNGNGQLGLGSDQRFAEDWVEVEAMRGVERVVCGPKCTLAYRP